MSPIAFFGSFSITHESNLWFLLQLVFTISGALAYVQLVVLKGKLQIARRIADPSQPNFQASVYEG